MFPFKRMKTLQLKSSLTSKPCQRKKFLAEKFTFSALHLQPQPAFKKSFFFKMSIKYLFWFLIATEKTKPVRGTFPLWPPVVIFVKKCNQCCDWAFSEKKHSE